MLDFHYRINTKHGFILCDEAGIKAGRTVFVDGGMTGHPDFAHGG